MTVEMKDQEQVQDFDYEKFDPQGEYAIEQWGLMRDLAALGKRLKTVMPGASELTPWQAVAYAQACVVTGANPFRGELYAWQDKDGKLVIDEGFKLLVRWAKEQCEYSEWYVPLESRELAEGDIGRICYVWRADQREFFQDLIKSGLDHKVALEIVTSKAVGVVKRAETTKAPPKGWTWEQRAEIRALKNALKQAYGGLSMAEVAKESWNVDGVPTQPRDWAGTEHMLPSEREATAAYNANLRAIREHPYEGTAQEAMNELFEDYRDPFEEPENQQSVTSEVESISVLAKETSTEEYEREFVLDYEVGSESKTEPAEKSKQKIEGKVGRNVSEIIGTKEKRGNGEEHKPPSFDWRVLQAVVDAGHATGRPHAAQRLAKSQVLTSDSSADLVVLWASLYASAREAENESEESAAIADATIEEAWAKHLEQAATGARA